MQGMTEQNFNPMGLGEFGLEQLHPKIFETFSRQYAMCPCSMTLALTLQRKNEARLWYGNINHGNQDLAQSKGGTGAAIAHEF